MRTFVATVLAGLATYTAALREYDESWLARPKPGLPDDSPVEELFPEIAFDDQMKQMRDQLQDPTIADKAQIYGGLIEYTQKKAKDELSTRRGVEHHDWVVRDLKRQNKHREAAAEDCIWNMKTGPGKKEQWLDHNIWNKQPFETERSTFLTEETYMKYVHNNTNRNAKEWILLYTYSPYGINGNHFQTYTIAFANAICTARAMDMNLGFIDLNRDENLKEMITAWHSGGYAFGVPYYVIVKGDGWFYHLQQKIYSSAQMIKKIDDITSDREDEFPGKFGESSNKIWYKERQRAPRNGVNIFFEYTLSFLKKKLDKKILKFIEKYNIMGGKPQFQLKNASQFEGGLSDTEGRTQEQKALDLAELARQLEEKWFFVYMRETLQNGQVKSAGWWILTRMILPAAGALVALIYILCRCVCGCCSGKASAVKAKAD